MRRDASLVTRLLAACFAGGVIAVGFVAGCSGWDPSKPFERNAPAVDEAIGELDAGHLQPAEKLLEQYLGTGPCSADAGMALPDSVRQKHDGSFDLGLTLFYLGERFGRRFGDEEEGGDGGTEDEAMAARRSAEVECALAIAHAIAQDNKVPTELRARARYLAGNLEFLRRKYEQAVKEYDQALALVPGILEEAGGDGIGRDAAWNRAIALRRIQDQKDAGTDAPDSSDGNDGSDGSDGSDAADGSDGNDAADGSDGNDAGPDASDGGDGGDKGDAGADGGDGGDGGQDGGADGGQDGGQKPEPQPPQRAKPEKQDDRMLDLLEQAPSYQEQEAKKRANMRRNRATMEDK